MSTVSANNTADKNGRRAMPDKHFSWYHDVLLGALTPIYLGWVASYAQEIAAATVDEADARVERLARAYEENKPYLVSRWRWPDRTG